jgi:hypothetical protein
MKPDKQRSGVLTSEGAFILVIATRIAEKAGLEVNIPGSQGKGVRRVETSPREGLRLLCSRHVVYICFESYITPSHADHIIHVHASV